MAVVVAVMEVALPLQIPLAMGTLAALQILTREAVEGLVARVVALVRLAHKTQ